MTEPRPRLTKTIGSVQQTNVVTDDVTLMTPEIRSRMNGSSKEYGRLYGGSPSRLFSSNNTPVNAIAT